MRKEYNGYPVMSFEVYNILEYIRMLEDFEGGYTGC